MVVRKFTLVLSTMLALLVVAAACGSDPTATPVPPTATPTAAMVEKTLEEKLYDEALATNNGEISWVFPTRAAQAEQVIAVFEADYPGLTVIHTQKSTSEVTEGLLLEHQAGKITADVADPGRDRRLLDRGVFSDSSDIFADLGIAEGAIYADGLATLYVPLAHGVMYNTDRVKGDDIPQTYEDLLDPMWKDDLVLEDRLKGFIYLTDLEEYGGRYENLWPEDQVADFLSKLAAQDPKILHGNTAVSNDVASGESAISPDVNVASIGTAISQGHPVELAPVTPNAIEQWLVGAVAGGPNPPGGRLFLRSLLTADGWIPARVEVQPGTSLDVDSGDPIAIRADNLGLKIGYTGIEMADHFTRLQIKYREILGIPTS
ncbi:MAG: extracellular solute-binding protein [Chloroflexi bacterium]|nr:extracellular solute-binding protein [Chloroflexota bacterium]